MYIPFSSPHYCHGQDPEVHKRLRLRFLSAFLQDLTNRRDDFRAADTTRCLFWRKKYIRIDHR